MTIEQKLLERLARWAMKKSGLWRKMEDMRLIQGQDGNWNQGAYMRGMYNGMELMMATLDGQAPAFRDAGAPELEDQRILDTYRMLLNMPVPPKDAYGND